MAAHQKTLVGVTLFAIWVLFAGFVATLIGSTQGEVASALGSVIGGAIGAGGAGYSVY